MNWSHAMAPTGRNPRESSNLTISKQNRVEFPSAQAAEAAGY